MNNKPTKKRLFEKAYKVIIQESQLAKLRPIIRTVASELHPDNFAFEVRPADSMATDNYAWFNVLIINRTTMNRIPIGAFTLQSIGTNRTELRVPPCSEWGRYDLCPMKLAVMAYSGSQYDGYFLEFIRRLQTRLKDDGLIVTWREKMWGEFKDFVATTIAKFVAEKTK